MLKRLALVLVALVTFGGSIGAYAWWDTLEETRTAETLSIGEGTDLTITVNASAEAGKTLIPTGVVVGANDVTSYTFTYDLALNKQAAADLTLTAVVSNIQIGGDGTNAGLITVTPSYSASQVINADTTVVVTLTVTMTEPATEAVYNAVANQDITFDVTFTAN
jgi:hypothetical protein